MKSEIRDVVEMVKSGELKIQVTEDYDKFKLMKGNRFVLLPHVDELVKSFTVKFIPHPILVNEKFEVIDGQHRLEACRRLGYPVLYIVIPGLSVDDCALLNYRQKNWTERNFAECFANRGNENYKRLLAVADEFGISVRVPMHFVHRSACKAGWNTKTEKTPLKEGTIIFTDEDEALVRLQFPKIDQLSNNLGVKRTNNFLLAGIKVIQSTTDKEFNRLLVNAEKYRHEYLEHPKVKGILRSLSDVYNYNAHNDNNPKHWEDLAGKRTA